MGIEGTAVIFPETKSVGEVSKAARWVHWTVYLLYVLTTFAIVLTVPWTDPQLPPIYGTRDVITATPLDIRPPSTTIVTVLAIYRSNVTFAALVNGCLIFSVISTAHTAICYASRTLFALASRTSGQDRITRHIRNWGSYLNATGLPAKAVFVSVVAFLWLQFLELVPTPSAHDVGFSNPRPLTQCR